MPPEPEIAISSALEFLWQRINYERTAHIPYRSNEFKLERMRELMRRLGEPHRSLPVIHIAGTKGKGSTAAMLASVMQAAGYRTGLYTSPHLEHIEERYRLNGEIISTTSLVSLLEEIRPIVEEMDRQFSDDDLRGPTFFEITTAVAFLHFHRQEVDVAVIEVGLGGRLDSTNVCQPIACAITSISFDHTRQLGNTLALIAGEKAGIIKSGVPIISGVTPEEPRLVIERVARDCPAPLIQCDRDYRISQRTASASGCWRFDFEDLRTGGFGALDNIALNLRGEHQMRNAGVALALLSELKRRSWRLDETALRSGLASVNCPGRIEFFRDDPPVILDTAHNMASIEALCRELSLLDFRGRRVLVFATSKDKDYPAILKMLRVEFDDIVLTRYVKNPRSVSPEELRSILENAGSIADGGRSARIHTSPNPDDAWLQAQSLAGKESLLCIAGSFFLAAELRPVLAATFAADQQA